VNRIAALVLLAATVSTAPVTRAETAAPPDFVGKCQAAVAKKTGVAAAAVKVRGKYKAQDGRTMLDFKLADGRVGVCRSKPDASVDEVKLEGEK
jgi:hypothetical protein